MTFDQSQSQTLKTRSTQVAASYQNTNAFLVDACKFNSNLID